MHWFSLNARIEAEATVGDIGIGGQREESKTSGPLPVLGIHVDHQRAEKWLVGGAVQYFSAGYEEYDGSILDAGVYMESLVNRNWGVGVGDNYFNIAVDVDEADRDANLEYEYSGIQAYASFRL